MGITGWPPDTISDLLFCVGPLDGEAADSVGNRV